jgi:hypothetical protein
MTPIDLPATLVALAGLLTALARVLRAARRK